MKEARDLEDSHPRPPQELKIPDVGNLLRKDISTSCHVCWCALFRKVHRHMTPGTNQKSPAVPPLHAANPLKYFCITSVCEILSEKWK